MEISPKEDINQMTKVSLNSISKINSNELEKPKVKKNRKRKKYKQLMEDMTKSNEDLDSCREKQKKNVMQNTGGGNFKKGNLDKI